jgi:hypothetical protein
MFAFDSEPWHMMPRGPSTPTGKRSATHHRKHPPARSPRSPPRRRRGWRAIGFRDLHIEPDWLLLYRIEGEELQLARAGTHADLFNE